MKGVQGAYPVILRAEVFVPLAGVAVCAGFPSKNDRPDLMERVEILDVRSNSEVEKANEGRAGRQPVNSH